MAGLWGTGVYTFVLARLGPLHLGCNREVAALLRWLLTQVHCIWIFIFPNPLLSPTPSRNGGSAVGHTIDKLHKKLCRLNHRSFRPRKLGAIRYSV